MNQLIGLQRKKDLQENGQIMLEAEALYCKHKLQGSKHRSTDQRKLIEPAQLFPMKDEPEKNCFI